MPFDGRTATTESVAALHEQLVAYEAGAIIVRSTTIVDEKLLHNTLVRFVATATAGADHVDQAYLIEHDITFASAAGSNANAVAEYVMLAIAAWQVEIAQLTLGIVGYGNVGRRLAFHARSVGMNVIVYDPPLAEVQALAEVVGVTGRAGDAGVTVLTSDLDVLLSTSDIVSLHVPLTHSGLHKTSNMISAEHISRLRSGALFVNTSRGGIVDEEALKKRLKSGEISVAVDVYTNEPLIDLDLVSLALISTPHIAGYTIQAKRSASRLAGLAFLEWIGAPTHNFDIALEDLSIEASLPRDLVTETNRMREEFGRIKSVYPTLTPTPQELVAAFDHLRKSYQLTHELLHDPE